MAGRSVGQGRSTHISQGSAHAGRRMPHPPRSWAVGIQRASYTRSERSMGTRARHLPQVPKDEDLTIIGSTVSPDGVFWGDFSKLL